MNLAVIMPVYNGMPYLKEAVKSILNQSYSRFELILIDDGSIDDSLLFLRSLKDVRAKIISRPNKGLCATLNEAVFEHARADYIARLDQDDVAYPDRLQTQMDFLEQNPAYGAVYSLVSRTGSRGGDFGFYRQKENCDISTDYSLDKHGFIVHSALMFRRELFVRTGGYRQEFYPSDDLDLTIRMTERSKFGLICKPLVQYRVASGASTFPTFSKMQKMTRYLMEMRKIRASGGRESEYAAWEAASKKSGIQQCVQSIKEKGRFEFRLAGCLAGEGRWARAAAHLALACLLNPRYAFARLLSLRRADLMKVDKA